MFSSNALRAVFLFVLILCFLWINAEKSQSETTTSTKADSLTDKNPNMIKSNMNKNTNDLVYSSASFSVILVSEVGDNTFFLALIMSMKHSRLSVYLGAMAANALMTILSVLLGNLVNLWLPKFYARIISVILFTYFAWKMFQEAQRMSQDKANEELDEAKEKL